MTGGPTTDTELTTYEGRSGDHQIEILIGHEGRSCYLRIDQFAHGALRREGIYPNARALSADLRAALGLGPAADWLRAQGVPLASDLYDLNHEGADVRAYFARTDAPLTPKAIQ